MRFNGKGNLSRGFQLRSLHSFLTTDSHNSEVGKNRMLLRKVAPLHDMRWIVLQSPNVC